MIDKICCALYPCIGQFANLFAIETIPSPSIKLPVEVINEFSVNEVYKGIANITRVIVVHGKIQEVDFHFIVSAYLLIEHFLGILIGNMANH